MLFFFLLLTSFIQFPIAVCACVAYVVCVCDRVCDVCGAGLGGGGGDGGGGARLELFPPSMQPESFWKGKRSVYK